MKVQLCEFRRTREASLEKGLAFLRIWDLHDIEFIVDKDGNKLDANQVWTYTLTDSRHIRTSIDMDL